MIRSEKTVWIVTIVVLLLLNVVTLTFSWYTHYNTRGVQPRDEQRPERFMARRLGLDETQVKAFREARKNHFKRIQPVQVELQKMRRQLFQKNIDGQPISETDADLAGIASLSKKLDSLTYVHFTEVRSYCTPEQAKKLDRMIRDMTQQRVREGRGGLGRSQRNQNR